MSPKKSAVVQEALDRFKVCAEAEEKQRKREIEDLRFQVPELQWPDAVRADRNSQTIAGMVLPERPSMSIPKLDQPLQLVQNQERAAHLGVNIHPIAEDANEDTAEVAQGLYRAIEVDSRAAQARSWAYDRFTKAGRGFWRIVKEYDDSSDHPSDQKLVIKRIYNQGSVYFDPASVEPDGSDAEYAFIVEDVPFRKYKRLYPKSKLATYTDEEFVELGNERPGWVTGDGEARAVRVAEYFYIEYVTEDAEWDDNDGKKQTRQKERRIVHWCKVNAVEDLETTVWEGRHGYIPIVRELRELQPFDNERRAVGVIGPNKDAQRLFNYAASASVEIAALEPKAPFDLDPEEIEGFEGFWNQANTRNFPYLPRHKFVGQKEFGPVARIQADTSKMQVAAMLLQQAGDFLHAGTSTFEPSLGNNSPNVRTKGATLALQQQTEQATSHWLDLHVDAVTHEARIILDSIPFVYDRPGRIARILDMEDNPRQVMLNAPYRADGNKKPQPVTPVEGQPLPPDVEHHDLTRGIYGVTVSVGKAYKSRVEQGKDELGMLFQAEPQLFSILGDIYLKFADFPGHREAAERVKKMLPPQLQDQDAQNDPKVQLDQAKAMIAQMEQKLKELEPERMKAQVQIETAKAKSQADAQIAGFKADADKAIAEMNNAAKIAVARITAGKASLDTAAELREEAIALNMNLAHEATQNELDRRHEQAGRQHEAAMAAAGAGQQAAEADASRQHDAQMADVAHQQALEQGAQGIDGQIAVQAAKPQPEAGA